MKSLFRISVASIALVTGTAALAQHQGHDAHEPEPAQPEHLDADHHHQHQQHETASPPEQPQDPHAGHDETQPKPDPEITASHDAHAAHGAMTGALGPYPISREASGTAWQPDTSSHGGVHATTGDWTLMAHGELNLVHDWQEKPRGDSKTFVSGMLMGMARRALGDGTLQFKAMVSPDPLMGKSGYPLLLASGETADGKEHLVDRQHPHDFFMELSANISQNIGSSSSLFLYAGLPGEPAFGPPAFMHRQSISVSPEAPISHHWLDSTHITFGVLTAGAVLGRFKVEASRFNGREPDQHRWGIETGPLDSTSVRLSFNPAAELALQASWAHLEEPEQLEPGVDQRRWSASAMYTRRIAPDLRWASTAAWGRKTVEKDSYDAFALESSLKWKAWTVFGRSEITENNELHHDDEEDGGEASRVGKISVGLVRDIRLARHFSLGVGALYAFNVVPEALEQDYGGDPNGAMAFLRLKLD